jgi:uncharacterized protein YhdP
VPRWLSHLARNRYARALGFAGLGGIAVALVIGFMVLAYELTAARVPEHRAALERLVRAQTGLDLRFAQLGVRWGWYGPEAVFSAVELGDPASSRVLLRAPELIVSFDAWRTAQTGHLEAGRITLVAPDVDLPRDAPVSAHAPGAPGASAASTSTILERWSGGRVDIEGGTLHLPEASDSAEGWTLAIRRASISRVQDQWSAQAFVLLPERLGTSARLDLRVRGDLSDPSSLVGRAKLEAVHVAFGGWRSVLSRYPQFVRCLPQEGGGDLSVRADFAHGAIQQANGSVRAGGVEFADAHGARHSLLVDRVRGDWRVHREADSWHAEIDDFQVGRSQSDANDSGQVRLDWQGAHLHAQATRLPVESLAALLSWAWPQLDVGNVELGGSAHDVVVDWDDARTPGSRLRARALLDEVAITPASHAFTLSGLAARVSGDERAWAVVLDSAAARLELEQQREAPLTDLRIASRLVLARSGTGWRVATEGLDVDQGATRLHMSGSVSAARADRAPTVQLRASLSDADVAQLQSLWGEELQRRFGASASHVRSGHIADAHFVLTASGALSGSLALTDARISDGHGLEAGNVDARVAWNGAHIRAAVDHGQSGPLELGPMQLAWRADGAGALEVAGRASGRLESTLAWIDDHAQLREYVPQVRGIAARGPALFDFDMSILTDARAPLTPAPHLSRAHVAVALEDATVMTGPGVPALESVRGALMFDGGHLQRSLLTGRWLGGPMELHLSERTDHHGRAFAVKAQGLMDVRQLAALGTVADPRALDGDAEWSGDFELEPETSSRPAHWQARLDAALTGVTSRLPEPLTKPAGIAAPLHVDVAGSSARAEVHLGLADRLHSVFEIAAVGEDAWRVERGTVRFGGTAPVALTADRGVVVSGRLARLDPLSYVAAWNRAERDDLLLPRVSGAVFVNELRFPGNVYADANLRLRGPGGAPLDLQVEPVASRRPGS